MSLPLEVTLKDKIYRFTTTWLSEGSQSEDYRVTLEPVSVEEFELAEPSFTSFDELLLSDYDNNGQRYLVSSDEGTADVRTKIELSFTASDLSEAANIANTRYQYYSDLARDLLDLSEKVAELSGVYCEFANQLGGNQLQENQRVTCQNNQQTSQADHLNLILTQSQLEDSLDNPAYIYYWQRRETDAYDHTLSETLGNGLVNTYNHNANTGRPNAIATHKGSQLFDHRLQGNTTTGRNIRFIEYRYDAHNNVTSRYDQALDIYDRWQYDGLDRVIGNSVYVSNRAQYGGASPEFSGSFTYRYDRTGNLTYKTDIGDYTYSNQQAGPHAVTKANGLNYQYDANGNMLRARADNSTE
ncbi:type IV secretion protein Rhs, partial [Vibrio brasiliensis]